MSHQFCFARNTGNCASESIVASREQEVGLSRQWHKDDFLPKLDAGNPYH